MKYIRKDLLQLSKHLEGVEDQMTARKRFKEDDTLKMAATLKQAALYLRCIAQSVTN